MWSGTRRDGRVRVQVRWKRSADGRAEGCTVVADTAHDGGGGRDVTADERDATTWRACAAVRATTVPPRRRRRRDLAGMCSPTDF